MTSSSASQTSGQYDALNPFLAVPVPLYIASGLDPRNEHTITVQKTGGGYLDLDYVATYRVGGGGPPGGEMNAYPQTAGSQSQNKTALIGEIVGGALGKCV